MSNEELKPCPFCGSSELLGFEASHEGGWTIVKCRKCGCSGSTGRSTIEQEATAFWNRRATHPAPAEQVEVAQVVSYLSACADGYDPDAPHPVPPEPLMTVAQHNRILAAIVPAGCKVVPVELLEDLRDLAADAVELQRAAYAGYKRERLARMDKTVADASALLASTGQEVEK